MAGNLRHKSLTDGVLSEGEDWEATGAHLINGVADLNIVRSATLVVAASDASAACRAQADAVCSGTADDVDIQAALDAVASSPYGKVVLTEGTFYLADTVNMVHYTTLEGQGMVATKLSLVASVNKDMISTALTPCYYPVIRNMEVYGNKANQTAGSALNASNMNSLTLENVYLGYSKESGFKAVGGQANSAEGYYLNHVISGFNALYGFDINNRIFRAVNCNAVANSSGGYDIHGDATDDDCTEIGLINCHSDHSSPAIGGYSYRIRDGVMNVKLIGCDSFNSGARAVNIDATNYNPTGIQIIGYKARSFVDDLLYINAVSGKSIIDLQIIGMAGSGGTGVNRVITIGAGTLQDSIISLCQFQGMTITDNITTKTRVKILNNIGWVTENSGTSSITSGQTTKVVAHGLTGTPTVITIAFREQGTNDFGRWWVDTIGATNFTLNVSADPGASNLDFAWEAKVR